MVRGMFIRAGRGLLELENKRLRPFVALALPFLVGIEPGYSPMNTSVGLTRGILVDFGKRIPTDAARRPALVALWRDCCRSILPSVPQNGCKRYASLAR